MRIQPPTCQNIVQIVGFDFQLTGYQRFSRLKQTHRLSISYSVFKFLQHEKRQLQLILEYLKKA